MAAKDNFAWWIMANSVAVVACAAIIAMFSPARPEILVPALAVLAALLMVPIVLRLIWPLLGQLGFLSAPMLLLAIATVVASLISLGAVAWNGGPFWMLPVVVVCLLVTGKAIHFEYRRHELFQRRLMHVCPACGFDLRASLTRCPECGTVIPEDYRYYLSRDPTSPLPEGTRSADEAEQSSRQSPPTASPDGKDVKTRAVDARGHGQNRHPRTRPRPKSKWAR